ncbi:MAG: hypothetical protein CL608_26710 [Anaerolineaceae bacterium]|nr:hypothetical protein [Anaerolineaceae bacterium]
MQIKADAPKETSAQLKHLNGGHMNQQKKHIQILNIAGLLSGLVAVVSIIIVGDTYGVPGTSAYQTYESFNRIMAVLILLESCAIAAFYMQRQHLMGTVEKILLSATFVAWLGMAVGTAAEFWLFSDQPYGANNMRSFAFSTFSVSSLIVGLSLLILGLRYIRNSQFPRYYVVFFLLYLPLDIVLFFSGQSIFLTSALFSILITTFTLISYLPYTRKNQNVA